MCLLGMLPAESTMAPLASRSSARKQHSWGPASTRLRSFSGSARVTGLEVLPMSLVTDDTCQRSYIRPCPADVRPLGGAMRKRRGEVVKDAEFITKAAPAVWTFIVSEAQVFTLLLYGCRKDDCISTLAKGLSPNVTSSDRFTDSSRSGRTYFWSRVGIILLTPEANLQDKTSELCGRVSEISYGPPEQCHQ